MSASSIKMCSGSSPYHLHQCDQKDRYQQVDSASQQKRIAEVSTSTLKTKSRMGTFIESLKEKSQIKRGLNMWVKLAPTEKEKTERLGVKQLILDRYRDKSEALLLVGYMNLTSLPPEICKLTHLKMLVVNNTQITSLPSEIGQLSNLQKLRLENNCLKSLPLEIRKLNIKNVDFMELSEA